MAEPKIVVIPISANIAIDVFRLSDEFHKDPADRLIVASARVLNCPLMSQDSKISAYSPFVVTEEQVKFGAVGANPLLSKVMEEGIVI